MICLDTDFVIDFLKEKPAAIERLKSFKAQEIVSTEVTYAEVLLGVFLRKEMSQRELQVVQDLFSSIRTLPLEHDAAYHAAEIAGALIKQGVEINFNDSLIGGICRANNCSILTRNIKHFSRIKGLKVEGY
jgi:tRNA(fMet)-specific endonuclease VapC